MSESSTTKDSVKLYENAIDQLKALTEEFRHLASKKKDETVNSLKVKIVNVILNDLYPMLSAEPDGKYLHVLNNDELPTYSDISLVLAQYLASMSSFHSRYTVVSDVFDGTSSWRVKN